MTTPLLLVAGGGLARETLAAIDDDDHYAVVGVLDDSPAMLGRDVGGVPVLGALDVALDHPDAQIVVCAGKGAARAGIVGRLTDLGITAGRYATVVHPDATVGRGCAVGRGSVLLAGVVLTADVVLGTHVVVMPHVTLTHDDLVEDYATLAAGATLGGDVRVGRGSYIGMNASVREHVRIGSDSTVGMGAVVLEDVPAGQIWAGVPARDLTARRSTAQGGGRG